MVDVSEKLSLHPNVWNAMRLVGVLIFLCVRVFRCESVHMPLTHEYVYTLTNRKIGAEIKTYK